jgi:hypothetical protein
VRWVIGSLASVNPGEWINAQGCWIQDREYGQQFRADMLTSTAPTSAEGIEKYLGSGISIVDERLKGLAMPSESDAWRHNPEDGSCRLVPHHGVVLVVTDEKGCETCFGFFRYPSAVTDIHGKTIADTSLADRWVFRNFVDTPDPRYRAIVKEFAEAGYVESIKDEYHPQP